MKTVDAVGVMFYSRHTSRYLYLLRSDPRHPECWGLPGGKVEAGESMMAAVERECQEELGAMPTYTKLIPIEKFTSADQHFSYHTFFCLVNNEFVPRLNQEHTGYAWLDSGIIPRPLHPGLYATVNVEVIKEKLRVIEQQEYYTISQFTMNDPAVHYP